MALSGPDLDAAYNRLAALKRVNLPDNLTVTPLKDYQTKAVAFHLLTDRSLINYPVGSGKTNIAIATAMMLRQRENIKRVLVVCQSSQIGYWKNTIRDETSIAPHVILGTPSSRKRKIENMPYYFFTVAHYHTVSKDINHYLKMDYDFVIIDEGTVIKNREARISRVIKDLMARAKHAMLLTATPLHNNLGEFHSLMESLDKAVLGDYEDFINRYCKQSILRIRRRGRIFSIRQITGIKEERIPELKEKIKYNCLTPNKDEIDMQLPPVVFKDLWLDMTETQLRKYNEVQEGVLISGDSIRYVDLLAKLVYQLRICDAARLVDPNEQEESPKISEIRHLLNGEYRGEKVIIFSVFRDTVDLIENVLKEDGIKYCRITGKEKNIMKREETRRNFSEDPSIKVMLITTAAEMGLNLQSAGVMIIVSRLYNPQRMKQIVGRIHRQGQKRHHVAIINLLMTDTVESRVLAILKRKAELYEAIFGKGANHEKASIVLRKLITGQSLGIEDDPPLSTPVDGEEDF